MQKLETSHSENKTIKESEVRALLLTQIQMFSGE